MYENKQSTLITDVGLTVRTYQYLKRKGIKDLKELSNLNIDDFVKDYYPNAREKTSNDIKNKMQEHNIPFK